MSDQISDQTSADCFETGKENCYQMKGQLMLWAFEIHVNDVV